MATYSSNLSYAPRALTDACHGAGIIAQQGEHPLSATVVLFEARESASLDARSAAELVENVRAGACLIYTLHPYAGRSAFWLSSILPSTGWTTTLRPTPFTPQNAVPIVASESAFFPESSIEGLAVPLGFDIRPTSAVERGQARYERYSFIHPVLKTEMLANSDLWSRPLLNREWRVRAHYDDFSRLPLLVTGRYGAGRVAMLATTAGALGESLPAQRFWRAVLSWLLENEDTAGRPPSSTKPTLITSFPRAGAARVKLHNPSAEAMPLQVVLRALDMNGATLPDNSGEIQRRLILQPRQTIALNVPLPDTNVSGTEVMEADKILRLRVGLLSADGSTLLAEQRISSLPNPLSLRVETENLYAVPYQFDGPGPNALEGFQNRMGSVTGAYAYRPGTLVRAFATISYQRTNLAPGAQIDDLTQPDNASVIALNDGAVYMHRAPPSDGIQAYGMWKGKLGSENVLQFTLPSPCWLAAVTVIGSFGPFANAELHNPGSAVIESNGRAVATVSNLDVVFAADYGQARITFPPVVGSVVTVRLPWVELHGPSSRPRAEPWVGEILLEGWVADGVVTTPLSGNLAVDLVDALSGERQRLVETHTKLEPCGTIRVNFTTTLPAALGPSVLRLEANFHAAGDPNTRASASAPILVIAPKTTLRPFTDLSPSGIFGTSLVVTNGFTKFFPIATGTSEGWNGWAHPDDLVWAYSRQFKEIPRNAHTAANRLYASQTDMRHYSIPWREFPNGELFFPTAIGGLIDYFKKLPGWNETPIVKITFGDRWVVGPDLYNCNSWQEYVAFDSHLRQTIGRGIAGLTHAEVETSIHASYENEWQAWQLERYIRSVRSVRDAFHALGKQVFIYSQCFPMVAGERGLELAQTIRGMNDDFTWAMQDNSPTLTTGRNLGEVAFNPVWESTTMIPWGFVSPVFNNWQWHSPVGTTEPNRRMLYNRLWRGMISISGRYGAVSTYGYTTNVGVPYTMTQEEYQHWWYVQERGSLLQPEAPLGAGLVISTQKNADPRSIRFNCNDATSMAEPRLLMQAFRSLHEAGVSLPFAANASTLASLKVTPETSLIILNLEDFSDEEIISLAHLQTKGIRMAAFAERSTLAPSAAALFVRSNTLLIEHSAAGLSYAQAVAIAGQLQSSLQLPIRFSLGIAGYGFRCQNISFVVVEDWLEQARTVTVNLRKSFGARSARASNLNDHSSLAVSDAGGFWEISLPLRSADGALLAIREA